MQQCFNCRASGTVSVHCQGCSGTGKIQAMPNRYQCVNCSQSGNWLNVHCQGCKGKGYIDVISPFMCINCQHLNRWNNVHCCACDGKGYFTTQQPFAECFNCRRTNTWGNVHCSACRGAGYFTVSDPIHECFNCQATGSWNSVHCQGCKGKGYFKASSTPTMCFNCSRTQQWSSVHCNGCKGRGYLILSFTPVACFECMRTGAWNSVFCKVCRGVGYTEGMRAPLALPPLPVLPQPFDPFTSPGSPPSDGSLLDISPGERAIVEETFTRGQLVNAPNAVGLQLLGAKRIYNVQLTSQFRGSIYELPLFHGTSHDACLSIAKSGFRMGVGGMLGGGIYFAPNPGKSSHYCDGHKMMLLCRVNLSNSRYAENAIFQEYCIYDVSSVLPVYVLRYT